MLFIAGFILNLPLESAQSTGEAPCEESSEPPSPTESKKSWAKQLLDVLHRVRTSKVHKLGVIITVAGLLLGGVYSFLDKYDDNEKEALNERNHDLEMAKLNDTDSLTNERFCELSEQMMQVYDSLRREKSEVGKNSKIAQLIENVLPKKSLDISSPQPKEIPRGALVELVGLEYIENSECSHEWICLWDNKTKTIWPQFEVFPKLKLKPIAPPNDFTIGNLVLICVGSDSEQKRYENIACSNTISKIVNAQPPKILNSTIVTINE